MKSILTIVKCYLIMVLSYISLIISDFEHLLMLVICVSSFQISFFFSLLSIYYSGKLWNILIENSHSLVRLPEFKYLASITP